MSVYLDAQPLVEALQKKARAESSLGFTPLGDRVVIRADVEDRAPEPTASGLLTAKTLAAAVDGHDVEESWFVGTVVALGPLVNRFDVRPYVLNRLRDNGAIVHLLHLIREIESLPADCPDPLAVNDRVVFSWASGQQLTIDGTKYLILKASEVLVVLDPEQEPV